MLRVEALEKRYGKVHAVKALSFHIQRGDCVGILGPNGAGKSTAIGMIATLIKPTSGRIFYNDRDITVNPDSIRGELGYVPQEIALYETLTGLDNLLFWGKAYGLKGHVLKRRIAQVGEIIGLEDRLKEPVSTYSGGMKRRLNIGVALVHEPKILILDEPTVGIDPQSRNHILDVIRTLNQGGLTVIYTSHYMEEIAYLCTDVLILDQGSLVTQVPVGQVNLEALFFELTGKALRD